MGAKLACSSPDESLLFSYFPFKARGFPILLTLELGKVQYNPLIVQFSDWNKMKESGQCPFGYLPLLEFPDGTKINETNACLAGAGVKARKCGATESAVGISTMLACKCGEIFSEVTARHATVSNVQDWNDEKKVELDRWANEKHSVYMTQFEALCDAEGKFTPEGDTIGEIHLFSNLFQFKKCGFIQELPTKLTKFYDRFIAMPAVKTCCDDKTKMGVLQDYLVPIPASAAKPVAAAAAALAVAPPIAVAPATAAVADYTIYYHYECKKYYGRAWAPLAMLKHAGKSYEVKATAAAPAGAGFAAPMIKFPEGHCIAQTNVLCALVGKDCGLSPSDFVSEAKAKQLCADSGDMMDDILSAAKAKEPEKHAERLNKWLGHLNTSMKGPNFLGDKLSFADFHVYGTIEAMGQKQSKGKLPGVILPGKLKAWVDTMAAIPSVKELKDSGIPVLPDAML